MQGSIIQFPEERGRIHNPDVLDVVAFPKYTKVRREKRIAAGHDGAGQMKGIPRLVAHG